MIEVAVLGPLRVRAGDRDWTPSRLKLRQLTGLLAVNVNRLVRLESMEAELWSGQGPARSASVLHTHVSQLRKCLCPVEDGRPATFSIRQTRLVGYTLSGPALAVDCQRFVEGLAGAREDLRAGRREVAAARLSEGLALWRGAALEDVRHGPVLAEWARRLDEMRGEAAEELADTLLALGRPWEVVDLLAPLVAWLPVREKTHLSYLLALERVGRRADAVRAYQVAARLMREHTGAEPGAALQALHDELTDRVEPRLEATSGQPLRPPAAFAYRPAVIVGGAVRLERPGWPTARLPGAGRAAPLIGGEGRFGPAARALAGTRERRAVTVVVAGPPGVGTSTFGRLLAQRVAGRFPGGVLFADLDEAPAGDVLARFAEGLTGGRGPQPLDVEERVGRFRQACQRAAPLVVLDHVSTVRDLDLLTPGTPGSAVVAVCLPGVLSRGAPGALGWVPVLVEPLAAAEATALFTRLVGGLRVEGQEHAVQRLVETCGGLPLALTAMAARLRRRPHWSIALLIERLRSGRADLLGLRPDGIDLCLGLHRSWRVLPLQDQPASLQLAAGASEGGHDVLTASSAARLLGGSERSATELLERLAQARLADPLAQARAAPEPGFGYRLHPLLPLVAAELSINPPTRVTA